MPERGDVSAVVMPMFRDDFDLLATGTDHVFNHHFRLQAGGLSRVWTTGGLEALRAARKPHHHRHHRATAKAQLPEAQIRVGIDQARIDSQSGAVDDASIRRRVDVCADSGDQPVANHDRAAFDYRSGDRDDAGVCDRVSVDSAALRVDV